MLVLGLGLKAKKIGPWPWDSKSLALRLLALALMSLHGLVNNHCHVYHVIINCVNVTITITIATTPRFPPPAKKSRVSLFEHYSTSQAPAADARQLERQLAHYMDYINASSFNCLENSMSDICQKSDFATLLPLFERVLCAPAIKFGTSGANIFPKWLNISAPSRKDVGPTARSTYVFKMQF